MAVSSTTNNAMAGFVNNQIKTQAAEKTKKSENTVELSDKAKSYLSKLQEKYKNVDFIISDYSTDDEASKKLRSGNGEYNCIITPDLLEKMAADEEVAVKYETIIDDSTKQLDDLKETVKEKGLAENVKNYGVSVDGNGKVNYYVLLKDGLSKLNMKNDTKENDKNISGKNDKADKSDSHMKKTTAIYGNTIDELLKKLEEYSQGKTDGKQKDELEITEKGKKEEETGIYKNYKNYKNDFSVQNKHHHGNEKDSKHNIVQHMLNKNKNEHKHGEHKINEQNKAFKYAYIKNTVEISKNKDNDFNGKV